MRLMVCAGASGGGVYPALAVLQALGEEAQDVLWVGGEGGMEADLISRSGLPFASVPAAGVHGVGWRALPGNLWQILKGFFAARKLVTEFNPDAMLFTGGFVAVPTALAGWGRPSLAYVPDIAPGLALRVVSRLSRSIGVVVGESRQYFPARAQVSVVGYPVRPELAAWNRQEAFHALELSPDLPTLLVFGGSKGAQSINRALLPLLPDLLAEMQVIHITGTLTWPEVQAGTKQLSAEQAARYRPHAYLHEEMGAAFRAADLVVARAGASTLGEFPLFGLPAILVPIPARTHLQHKNAHFLTQRGAALTVNDEDMRQKLLPAILELMRDSQKRAKMESAMQKLARPDAAQTIASLLRTLVSEATS
jgi:undecaprenyldiphospho-muramoylpentapeptide beta-N-acetylglucosaminyltransferase